MRNFIAKIIFLFHIVIVSIWLGLFFIPEHWFPNKVSFQFNLSLLIVGHQFIWGFLIMPWSEKYRMVCFLTTVTQLLRGQKLSDPKNYDHSFTQEFFKEIGVNIPHRASTLLAFTILVITAVQYFF